MVAPDRLRFDFSHHEALTPAQLDQIEALANAEIIGDAPVRHYETTKEHAESLGAIAFFGDKYGDLVRVLEAGEHSIELCGGTHVHALGFIGPIKIVSEGSIGANLRRIEAVTGDGALARIHDEEAQLRSLADLLKVAPGELPDRVEPPGRTGEGAPGRVGGRAGQAGGRRGGDLGRRRPSTASSWYVATGSSPDDLRRLAVATRDALGSGHRGSRRARSRRRQGRARGRGEQGPRRSRARRPPTSPATRRARSAAGRPRTPTWSRAGARRSRRSTRRSDSSTRRSTLPPGDRAPRRVLGVDLGSRRIGFAATDRSGCSPAPTRR